MIIADNRIKAAACILPVAQATNLPKEMGLRHRSGLGMSIETDALIIIVSEERGKISVAQNGKIEANVTAEELQQILSKEREVKNYC
jgi:DNA integrity scanning protein DisA with diadenylate cyclase activity